ncbi:MAG: helix-turn-helix transcriptional regulator [Gemmatimonadota bacterium]
MSDPATLTPLRPVVFEIILILSERPAHGYGIMKTLRERPAGRWVLGPGTLYRTLNEMRTLGIIEEAAPESDSEPARRRLYRLTGFGRKVGAAETRRMESLVAQARSASLLEGH